MSESSTVSTPSFASAANPDPPATPARDWDPGEGRPWTGRARIIAIVVCGIIAASALALAALVFVDDSAPTITPTAMAPSAPLVAPPSFDTGPVGP